MYPIINGVRKLFNYSYSPTAKTGQDLMRLKGTNLKWMQGNKLLKQFTIKLWNSFMQDITEENILVRF